MFSANGSSRAYGRLTSKLRRLALGTAYALRPRRISVLPAVAASVVRTSVGLERRDACLVIDDPQPRHPLGFVGICGDLDPDSLMQGFRRGLYPFSHVGRKKWWMLPQRMSLAPHEVVRDKDVLMDLSKRTDFTVCVSVPCVDEDVWRALEPGTAPPMQRLRAVRELADAGVHAGVLMSPIVPGISSRPALLEQTLKAAVDHGARFVGANVMHLEGGTRDHFMRWLEAEHPELVDGYRQLYATKYAPSAYRAEVKRVMGELRKKHGIAPRGE